MEAGSRVDREAEFQAFHEATAWRLRAYLRPSVPADTVDDTLQEAYLRLLRTPHATLPHDERRAHLYLWWRAE